MNHSSSLSSPQTSPSSSVSHQVAGIAHNNSFFSEHLQPQNPPVSGFLGAGPGRQTDENVILQQLNMDSMELSPDSAKLAQVIVRAMLSITNAKLEEERKRHDAEIASLKSQVEELMVERDDLENYGRRNTIVISGPSVPPSRTHEDCYEAVTSIVSSQLGVKLDRQQIDVCHRLPVPKSNKPNAQLDATKKPIIVKFTRRETKHVILRASRTKKPKDIYFNESLSSTRQKILYVVRKVKASHPTIVASYKTEDCNIRVFSPSPGDPSRFNMTTLNTRRALDEFLLTKLGHNSSRYLEDEKWTTRRSTILASAPVTSGISI